MAEMLWSLRARSLAKARKALLRGQPEGLHDLRVALRRSEATAAALGKKKVEKRAGKLVRSLSELRQLEVDRGLLGRIREAKRIPEGVAATLDARWSSEYTDGLQRATRIAEGRKMKRIEKALRRLARRARNGSADLLEKEREDLEERLAPPPEDASDRRMHRFRIAVKRARYLAEDLAASGIVGLENRIEREKDLQDALGRWNDLRLFRGRLQAIRSEAEERGSVVLAAQLDPVVAALEGTLSSARREVFAAANRFARVLPFLERSA